MRIPSDCEQYRLESEGMCIIAGKCNNQSRDMSAGHLSSAGNKGRLQIRQQWLPKGSSLSRKKEGQSSRAHAGLRHAQLMSGCITLRQPPYCQNISSLYSIQKIGQARLCAHSQDAAFASSSSPCCAAT